MRRPTFQVSPLAWVFHLVSINTSMSKTREQLEASIIDGDQGKITAQTLKDILEETVLATELETDLAALAPDLVELLQNQFDAKGDAEAVQDNLDNLAGNLGTVCSHNYSEFATLVNGTIPNAQIPPLALTAPFVVASEAAMLALTAQTGDVAIRTDSNQNFILNGTPTVLADWIELRQTPQQVNSVNGRTGNVDTSTEINAAISALNLGTISTHASTDYATASHTHPKQVSSTTSASSITPDGTKDIYRLTALATGLTINNSSNTPNDGDLLSFQLIDNGTSQTIGYGNAYVAKAGVSLPPATTISKRLTMLFQYCSDLSKWNLLATGLEA